MRALRAAFCGAQSRAPFPVAMTLSPGTRLGRYEIRSKLGTGGMSEVYLAHDTQLRRPVALKFLSLKYSQNEERLRRFKQEAYAVAARSEERRVGEECRSRWS